MRIRRAGPNDAAAIAAIYAPYVVDTAISFELTPPNENEMRQRILAIGETFPWLVAEEEDRLAGYVYASQHHARAAYQWSADVAAYLHPDYHRKGLGRRLYGVLFGLLQEQGFHSAFAGITLPNAASVGLHRAIGMSEVGVYREAGFKLGAWRDVLWMGMRISSGDAPVKPPLSVTALPAIDQRKELNTL